jgi:hypothetical protein
VTWRARPTLGRFFDQYRNYARGDGHARLWPRRHAVRYGAYVTGLGLLVASRRSGRARAALAVGGALYLGKYYRRVLRHAPTIGRRDAVAAGLLVPVVVVAGDVAKMLGYPVGRWERRRAGGESGLARLIRDGDGHA